MTAAGVNPAGRLLVLGGGYTGQRFAQAALHQGFEVLLTSRVVRPTQTDLHWLRFDSTSTDPGPVTELKGISHVLVTVAPQPEGGDPVLQRLTPMLQRQPLQWLGYLSTTGVYGSTAGGWVDESALPKPGSSRSQGRLKAEQAWQNTALPVQVFRLPAIYGPHRSPFQALRQGRSRLLHKPGQVFSRVHVDDIVGALLHCLALPADQRPAVVNVTDDWPCPSTETLAYAAHLLGLKLPVVHRYADSEAELSPMARSFWAENRRASNQLLCQQLGYQLQYPTYREGYRASLDEERQSPEAA
jgi:nucleoside-diphosphate-sugar epimerase